MKWQTLLLFCLGFAIVCPAQNLTQDQKLADFQQLSALCAKNYAPYEWKVATQNFDLLNIGPWLARVRQSKDDLEFLDICVEYVAALNDAHDVFTLPSDFEAYLGFIVDLYDGKPLINSISRSSLPVQDFPFAAGDELVSVDGKTAEELITAFNKYSIAANSRSTRRFAAELLTHRVQWLMPRAHEIGDTAIVVIRRQSGALETYTIPWQKSGTPMLSAGPVPSPKSNGTRASLRRKAAADDDNPPDVATPSDTPTEFYGDVPAYPAALQKLQNVALPPAKRAVLNFGGRSPIFAPPANFQQRLGRSSSDVFFSGTFQAGGFRIGFIRIPDFAPLSTTLALQQFDTEIAYMQANTDGLIVDEMRNPGGSICYDEAILTRLIPYSFRTLGFEIRATASWVADFSNAVTTLQLEGAPQYEIDLVSLLLRDVKQAYGENRGRTGPEPLCNPGLMLYPVTDRNGNVAAYRKPLMVLADELSASGGDAFAAIIQDNQRGPIFGMRTMGAGGNVVDMPGTTYSEGFTRMTESLMNRQSPIVTSDYPTAPYVENIGVRPDIVQDYMTLDNLTNRGKTFVQAFSDAMVSWIQKNQ